MRCEQNIPGEVVIITDVEDAPDDGVGEVPKQQGADFLVPLGQSNLHAQACVVAFASVIVLERGVHKCSELLGHILLINDGEFVSRNGQAVFGEVLELVLQ